MMMGSSVQFHPSLLKTLLSLWQGHLMELLCKVALTMSSILYWMPSLTVNSVLLQVHVLLLL